MEGDERLTISGWPNEGRIEFKNVSMRYRNDMPLVLCNMNFEIMKGEKVGCVGRTGSGKSSILQALFRMTEIESNGKIFIDNEDISTIGLHKLRSQIGIIPQQPFIFSGSIRRNIDPLEVLPIVLIIFLLFSNSRMKKFGGPWCRRI